MLSPLFTDFYQITMAYGYWKLGLHEREAVFHHIFRTHPYAGNYAVACGLGSVIAFLQDWRFTDDDLDYLAQLKLSHGEPTFEQGFLDYLRTLTFSCDIDAVAEGTVMFAQEPLIRIKGPLLQCQLLESPLLNMVNFQTLIATKASRLYRAAQGETLVEFGLRRAQGPDGAMSASRAAYVGGCHATSNVLAGKNYDIPVRGTHAHSWVTAFPDEPTAFDAYASVMPHNCVLLVDTFDSIEGIKHAIETGKTLRANGAELLGVRLDSGDMTALSQVARKLLDEAGFTEAMIMASNSLNETSIAAMKQAGANISAWGVGTHLVTSYDQPALDGVYKLSALRDEKGQWQYKLKLSEQSIKISNPGIYQVQRYFNDAKPVMDVMYDLSHGISDTSAVVAFASPHEVQTKLAFTHTEELLLPIFRQGKLVYQSPSIHMMRDKAISAVKQFIDAHGSESYPVCLEEGLHQLKQTLIKQVSKSNGK